MNSENTLETLFQKILVSDPQLLAGTLMLMLGLMLMVMVLMHA